MNARSFFTEQDFAELKSAWVEKRKTGLFDHEKTVKVNGNTYTLSAYVGQYVFGDRNFFASGMIQYNYACKDLSDGRSIGGGTYLRVILDGDYEDFLDGINYTLERFPDYKQPACEQLLMV